MTTNAAGFYVSIMALSITIVHPAPSVTTSSPMPNGTVGVAYSQTLAATGGDNSYTWALFNATTLPAGLVLNTGTGEISGPPSAAGTTNFEVQVTSAAETATKALSITIVHPAPSVTTSSPMPNGTVGVAYSQTLAATTDQSCARVPRSWPGPRQLAPAGGSPP